MPPSKTRNLSSNKKNKSTVPRDAAKSVAEPSTSQDPRTSIPIELQQLLLNIFKNSFSERLESDIAPLLQEVKGHLYNRDFLTAFGRNDYLEAYAARWSPSRALGYAQVLIDIKEHIFLAIGSFKEHEGLHGKVVCLGGGAGAEIVALGGFHNFFSRTREQQPPNLDVVAIDIANWSQVVEKLRDGVTTAPPLSKYASPTAKAANAPLARPESLNVAFNQHDILNTDFSELASSLQDAKFVTLMFTLNELYSTSLPLTQKFLLNLTACLQQGALLLVIDSPGSYSTVSLNDTEKKYPMQWLLDHMLLRSDEKDKVPTWTKVLENESRWFRLPKSLNYPIDLENMRYQLHVYKRCA
ncbi:hypothetical protein K469DRAFT_25884 [Zopfia rhizophila CBS 207.26]|uniref:25S rRNA (Uridine(2843)-N(3))-methyltransferase n=1 Tax=Zopfia rhizophila CBS 207.26 TaxID=1314779 RepID=A0A6A6EHR7_9PEZI|nr:hypothetical protein K469DRAFT_25884 [Zopfia rhizophila CBS 207.26]